MIDFLAAVRYYCAPSDRKTKEWSNFGRKKLMERTAQLKRRKMFRSPDDGSGAPAGPPDETPAAEEVAAAATPAMVTCPECSHEFEAGGADEDGNITCPGCEHQFKPEPVVSEEAPADVESVGTEPINPVKGALPPESNPPASDESGDVTVG